MMAQEITNFFSNASVQFRPLNVEIVISWTLPGHLACVSIIIIIIIIAYIVSINTLLLRRDRLGRTVQLL